MMTRALTDEEYEVVRDRFRRIRDAAAFVMSIRTDLYLSELLLFKIGDVQRSGRIVESIEFIRSHNRWGGNALTIAFDSEVRLILADLIQEIRDRGGGSDSFLFCGRDLDKPLSPQRLYLILHTALADLGRDVGLKSLRLPVGSKGRRKARDRRSSAIPDGWLKKADVKRIYGVPDADLRRWVRCGWLPRLRAGSGRGFLVYRPDDIERIKHKLKSIEK